MTVSAGTTKITYNCNGSLREFDFAFAIYKEEDLTVIVRDTENNETLLVLNTDYTVSSDNFEDGGVVSTIREIAEVFLPFAWPDGYTITIMLNIALTQETDLLYGGTFSAKAIEKCSDKLTRIVQQLDEQLQRSLKLHKSSGQDNVEIDDLVAGKFVVVNTAGNGLIMGETENKPAIISNDPYDKDTWNGKIEAGASKNAIRDELVNNRFTKGDTYATVLALTQGIFTTLPVSNIAYGDSWANIVDTAASKKALYEKIESIGAGSGDVAGPATNTNDYVPQWNGADSKTLKNGFPITAAGKALMNDDSVPAQRTTLGLGSAALRTAKDELSDGSDLPDGHAIITYGEEHWASGEPGDVVGPASAINNAICLFNATTGKLIKDSTRIIEDELSDGSDIPDGHAIKIYGDTNWGNDFTNLTEFLTQTAWRLFYSNAAGDVTELALGTSGQYLKANGAAAAPTWAVPAGGGDVVGPATHSATLVPQWGAENSKTLVAGFSISNYGKVFVLKANPPQMRTALDLGDAALRTAENELSDGSKLPDGHAIKVYGDANWGASSGDVIGPATNTNNYVPQWNGANSKTLKNGFAITDIGKTLINKASVVLTREYLGFGWPILDRRSPQPIGTVTPDAMYSDYIKLTGEAGFQLRSINGSGNKTINWTTGNKFKLTMTGNVTLSFGHPTNVCNVLVEVVQPAGGGCTINWPGTVAWTPTIDTASNAVTIVCFFWDGAKYYGGGTSNA